MTGTIEELAVDIKNTRNTTLFEKIKKVNAKTKKKMGSLYNASLALIASSIPDIASTVLCMNKYGIDIEQSEEAKYFAHHLGAGAGLLVHSSLALPIIIFAAHMLNKKLNSTVGTYLIYSTAVLKTLASMYNFSLL
jgi:hypothetical protein